MRIRFEIRCVAASLTVLLFGQACGVSGLRGPATAGLERMPFRQDTDTLTVGAETSTWVSGQHEILGAWVRVQSRAAGPVTLWRDRITLELPDGAQLSPVEPADATGPAPQAPRGGAGAASMCVMLPLCVIGLAFLVVGLAGAALEPAAEAAHEARVREFEAKGFPGRVVLGPGERAEGLVFFRMPPRVGGAIVLNMAGAPPPRPRVLDLAIEERADFPPSDREPGIVHLRLLLER